MAQGHPATVSNNGNDSNNNQATVAMSNIQNAISEMLKNIRNSTSSCTNESTQSVQNRKIAERTRPRESTNGSKNNGKDGESKSPSSTSNDKNTKIKRPMNAFMVWAREYRTILSKGFPKESNSQISVRLGDIWSNLTNEEKKPFYDRADKLRRQHEKDYPDWVYQPNKKRRIATSLPPQYPNQYIINASNHGITPTDSRNVKILPRPIIVSSSEVGTTQSQVLVHAPQGDSTVNLLPREQMNQKEEISASRHTEWIQSSSNQAFQNTSAPMRTNQTAPSTNGMIQNRPAVPRQLTVATPANSVSIGANTLTHQVPTLQATGPIHTPTKGPATSFVEVSPLSADRFQTLLSQHPIASLIGQLSPECKTAQDGQPTVDRHPIGSRKMKPAASKPPKGNQISSAEPVMSTGYENTSWGYVTGPYPRLPISGYPSQTQNAVPTSPLMHNQQQQQGCPLVQLPSPHQYIGPNHPGCSLHPYVHQVMASPMGAGAVYGPVVRPLRMRPDYSHPPPQLMLPAQRGVMMYASPRPIHPAIHSVEGFNQREAVGFPTQAGNVQSHPCKRNAENNDRNVHVGEGRRYVVENTQRIRNGNNSNNTAIKTNDLQMNNNIYNNNNNNNNNNNDKAKDNQVSESNSKSITGNTTSYTNNSIPHNKRAAPEMVSDYAKNETKCHNNVNQTVQTSIKNDIKTQQQPTTSQDRQQLEAVRANGVKPGSRTETAPLPRNKSFLQTLGSPISSNDVAEQLAKLIRPPMQPYAVAKKTPSSQQSAPQPHQSTTYISQSPPEAQEKRHKKPDILSQCVEQVFSKPDMKQVEFVTIDQNSPMFQFVKPVVKISEGTGNKYRLVAMETVSPTTTQQFESPVAGKREQVLTNLNESFQVLEKDNFPRNIFQTSSGSSLSSEESPPNVKHQKPIDLSIVNATTGVSVVQHCDRLPEGCDRFLLNMDSKEILVNTQGWDVQRCGQMEHGPNLGDRKMLVQIRKAHDEMCKNHQN